MATKRLSDGREVFLQNAAGRQGKKDAKMQMWKRQNGICSLFGIAPGCPGPLSLVDAVYEHAEPKRMGGGFTDDRIVNEKGDPQNSVCHKKCNNWKGSMHFQPPIPTGMDPDTE